MIDLAILIGVALIGLKAADFLLLPHQQDAIQDEFDTIALEITDADLKKLALRFNSELALRVFTVLTYFEFILIALIVYIFQASEWAQGGLLAETFPDGRSHQFGAILVSFVTLAFVWRWPLPQILGWVTRKATWWSMFLRFVAILGGGFFFFGVYQLCAVWILSVLGQCDGAVFPCGTSFFWAIHLVWPAFVVFWVVTQCIGLLLQIRIPPVRWFAQALLFLAKHTIWRIAVYNKGALAGVVALVTFGLGIIKLFL